MMDEDKGRVIGISLSPLNENEVSLILKVKTNNQNNPDYFAFTIPWDSLPQLQKEMTMLDNWKGKL